MPAGVFRRAGHPGAPDPRCERSVQAITTVKRVNFHVVGADRSIAAGAHREIEAARVREESRWRRALAIGIVGTVLIHFLVLIAFRDTVVVLRDTSSASGPPRGDIRPAGGGSGLTMVEVRPEQPAAQPVVEEVPVPIPVPDPVEVVVPEEVEEPVPEPEPAPDPELIGTPSEAGTGGPGDGGQGGSADGPDAGDGDGLGGGGSGSGGPAAIVPPRPRGLFIPPPGRPASARGQEITVWVFVSEAGRVDRNTVRLEPPTSDARYNQRLIQSVSEWVFDPARQEGRAVSTWFPFQIIL